MKLLVSSLNFWLLNIVFSFIYAVYNTLGAAVGVITEKFGYSSTDNSVFGVVFIISGITGSFVHAILLDKYSKYKLQLILVCVVSTISVGVTAAVIDVGELWLTSIALFFLGIGLIPIIAVGNSLCAEITYPISEALGCGLILSCGSLLSIPYTLLVNYMVKHYSKWWSLILFGAGTVIGLAASLLVKENLKKTQLSRESLMENNNQLLEKELLAEESS